MGAAQSDKINYPILLEAEGVGRCGEDEAGQAVRGFAARRGSDLDALLPPTCRRGQELEVLPRGRWLSEHEVGDYVNRSGDDARSTGTPGVTT